MDSITQYHHFKDLLSSVLGESHHVLHIHAGLAIYLGTQIMLGTRRASGVALATVFGLEGVNEGLDWIFHGELLPADTLQDIFATVMWPSILFASGWYRRHQWREKTRHNRVLKNLILLHAGVLQRAITPSPAARPAVARRSRRQQS